MDWIQFTMLFLTLLGMFYASHKETKDFHGRLCALEERYVQMMQRVLEKGKK